MRMVMLTTSAALMLSIAGSASAQNAPKTLVAIFAHGDDETTVAPILARYARESANVYLIIATDGAQGGSNTSIPRGPELARVRADEARCATDALGIHPPIMLGFPDGALGNYSADPAGVYRLAQRLSEELQRLRPDALLTWGPEGGTGHPDHRLVGSVVMQVVRTGTTGLPERVFFPYMPAEGFRAINPARGAPPLLVPHSKYVTVRVPFTTADMQASRRSFACHRTQYGEDVVQRVTDAMSQTWNGMLPLVPAFPPSADTDLFSPPR
jgi:LmbE family N-acetylglucosaminyl deacetylase